ncbi:MULTISPECIES: hypothetical protein [Amycolatopsis]|uniref:Secreted protein n=1 Tax=Amycolatopsis bullii TaxID=941987 RepID=A0ABQ3JYV4_9PSEU|nr:hypothetical protein [Amycolatopsis bullii]GHF94387.1 hypothetical protein GCM10017567_06070 [Amycolatopsis bullii]
MKKVLASGVVMVLFGLVFAVGSSASADPAADTGRVVVFSSETQALDNWDDPAGCQKLPVAAHVLVNETDRVVDTYADPFCVTPGVSVQPGYGTHVAPGTGSFSVGE